jgi:hypothetical protein
MTSQEVAEGDPLRKHGNATGGKRSVRGNRPCGTRHSKERSMEAARQGQSTGRLRPKASTATEATALGLPLLQSLALPPPPFSPLRGKAAAPPSCNASDVPAGHIGRSAGRVVTAPADTWRHSPTHQRPKRRHEATRHASARPQSMQEPPGLHHNSTRREPAARQQNSPGGRPIGGAPGE